jgi:hypothetical protein
MPKNKEEAIFSLQNMEKHTTSLEDSFSKAKKTNELDPFVNNTDYFYELPDGSKISKKDFEQNIISQKNINALKKAEIENFTQKQLLDKNHQERFLQEFVNYAAQRGDINKVRVPTSETAAKVQGYRPATNSDQVIKEYNKVLNTPEYDRMMADLSEIEKVKLQKILKGEIKGNIYDSEYETILKKYAELPKTIKKLFGKEPTIVTDGKGNTWYEFDIPDKFKKGKGEIKAFKQGGQLQQQKMGGQTNNWLDKYN